MTSPDQPSSTLDTCQSLFQHGMSLLRNGAYSEAATRFEEAFQRDRNFLDAALAWCHCRHLQGDYLAAVDRYDQLTDPFAASPYLWNNRGVTLLALGRHGDAAASFQQALRLAPDLHQAQIALASCYQALGLVEQARSSCLQVLASDPDNAEAHWNYSLLLLLAGEYRQGWQEYEWRWKRKNFTSPRREFHQPRWDGLLHTGTTVLVHAEQGYGDTLQFCRYLPLMATSGVHVVFECHRELVPLMQSLQGTISIVARGELLPHFDQHIPLLSLPQIFGTTLETIPTRTPYLKPPAEKVMHWQNRLGGSDGDLKVGLCWGGKAYPDPARSCPSEELYPLSTITGISWYSLQIGWDKALPFPMTNLTDQIADFSDSAALIEQLDLVITIDTAMAHLAGALGKPVWVMLPFAPDWRWLLQRPDSPWYPAMRLFRQPLPSGWSSVINSISSSLEQLRNHRNGL